MQKSYWIQYLRAFAALAVVYFHAAVRAGVPGGIGSAGVDVFFVISGFIMWSVAETKERSPALFLYNRAVRVAPPYWFYTALMLLLAASAPLAFPNFSIHWRHVLASFLFIPYPYPNEDGSIWPVLVQGWTLNYEMFFYLLFAGSLLLPSGGRLLAMLLVLGGLASLGSFYHGTNPLIVTYTDPIVLEFVLGMAIGWLRDRGWLPSTETGFSLILVGAELFMLSALTGIESPRLLVWGLPAAVLVTGAAARMQARDHNPLLTALGDSSYSTYLTHLFVISVLAKIVDPVALSWGFVALAMAVSAAVGYVSYRVLERPILRVAHGKRLQVAWAALRKHTAR